MPKKSCLKIEPRDFGRLRSNQPQTPAEAPILGLGTRDGPALEMDLHFLVLIAEKQYTDKCEAKQFTL
jgi:hypothetical protein